MIKNKRDWIKIIAIIIAIIQMVVLFVVFGVEQTRASYPETMPKDFDFVASLWTDSYTIDTYRDTYTKAIDWEVDTMITLRLTQEEKELIYETIKKIDIYKYPQNYAPISVYSISPSFTFFIKMTINGNDRSINWTENTESESKDAKRLRKLFEEITGHIEKHKEIKELPESKRCFY